MHTKCDPLAHLSCHVDPSTHYCCVVVIPQVRRSKADPDLSQKLSDGLSYLNADEMEEVQQALAMSIYAHSVNYKRGGSGYKAVKVITTYQFLSSCDGVRLVEYISRAYWLRLVGFRVRCC